MDKPSIIIYIIYWDTMTMETHLSHGAVTSLAAAAAARLSKTCLSKLSTCWEKQPLGISKVLWGQVNDMDFWISVTYPNIWRDMKWLCSIVHSKLLNFNAEYSRLGWFLVSQTSELWTSSNAFVLRIQQSYLHLTHDGVGFLLLLLNGLSSLPIWSQSVWKCVIHRIPKMPSGNLG